MNISTNTMIRRTQYRPVATSTQVQAGPTDQVTLRMRRSTKRKLITGGCLLAGAGVGSMMTANFTGQLTGTAAKIAGGTTGAVTGALVAGAAGLVTAGLLTRDQPGFGGYGAILLGTTGGAVAGAIGGAFAGAALGQGAGNVLGYAAGAIAGGALGGLVAKGINS